MNLKPLSKLAVQLCSTEKMLVYFLITHEKDLDSPRKPEKSFPSQVFISLSSHAQFKESETENKTLPWSNEGRTLICPVLATV